MIEKVCEECGEKFLTTKESRKFCSHPCYSKSRNTQTQKLCIVCNGPFSVRDCYKSSRQHCSRKCAAHSRKARVSLICQECGSTFEKNLYRSGAKYCSSKCRQNGLKGSYTDLTGLRVGKLIVVEFSHIYTDSKGNGAACWKCRCDCGTELIVKNVSLRGGQKMIEQNIGSGRIQCDNCSPRTIDGYSHIRLPFKKAEMRAKKADREFAISLEYMRNLLDMQNNKCAISGIPLVIRATSGSKHFGNGRIPNILSIDRIDSSKGYIEGNVQWVTAQVNFFKSEFPTQSLIDIAYAVVKANKVEL